MKKKSWLKRVGLGASAEKSHRVCRHCHQVIRKHERWRQVKRKILGLFGTVFEIEHRDCADPKLANAKLAAEPEPPIDKWLREHDLPLTTWTSDSPAETIQ